MSENRAHQVNIGSVTEYKTKVIGTTSYNLCIAYNENGESINKLLLLHMKEKQKGGKSNE